ncbi:synaptotagmin-15 isoform X2 [Brienomyrus brachyistius]|uniref:synaptotagmin-15 isoform X2 n=1 Tax=Brienomyrus brachyistius TaxID=42636 RepID=UPI0020B1E2DF|nr:synaptotagmin-15 isoform X2 [Brienomyrus brachyistius]
MAVPVVLLAGGLVAGVFLLLFLGVAAYVLWRRRQVQGRYRELLAPGPAVPRCITPVMLGMRRLEDIPFQVPRSIKRCTHSGTEGQEGDEEAERGWSASFPLGRLQPHLYQVPLEPSEGPPPAGGSVQLCFGVAYRPDAERLLVSVLRAANLPPRCQSGAVLVKLQLLPGGRCRHQAKARQRGCDPSFRDSFVFQVSSERLDQCTLCLSLFSVDGLKKHHLEGRVLYPLKEWAVRDHTGQVLWRDVETDNDQPCSERGDIQVSLNYSPPLQRLTVMVLRARGLRGLHSDPGMCIQVTLQIHTQVVTRKRTAAMRGGTDPTFCERLSFKLPPKHLDEACLSLEVLQASIGGLCSAGLVVIGPFMYARGRELEHWSEMVSKPQELVRRWHGLGSAPGQRPHPLTADTPPSPTSNSTEKEIEMSE